MCRSTFRVLTRHNETDEQELSQFADEVLTGLSQPMKRLPTRYIYDTAGMILFQKIMVLPEYYLTRCETEVIEENREALRALFEGQEINLVELGSGDGTKTKILLNEFLNHDLKFRYVPIDISKPTIEELVRDLNREYPGLEAEGLVAEYFQGLRWLSDLNRRRNVVLFLGSNIGNFTPDRKDRFVRNLWKALNHDDYVLIGFDLKKDIAVMQEAYNDSRGVTARFNLNLLKRINRELGGDFDLEQFRFFSTFDPCEGAVQSYLVSLREQTVFIEALKCDFRFKAWEPVHTESSYKFTIEEIEALAEENLFETVRYFYDSRKYFVDSLWRVCKEV
jgi:L-histidine N-alpha-methyltransferase